MIGKMRKEGYKVKSRFEIWMRTEWNKKHAVLLVFNYLKTAKKANLNFFIYK